MFTMRDVSHVVHVTNLTYPTIRPMIKDHLMSLSDEDKYRRFYIPTSESTIDKYLAGIELRGRDDAIFVVYNSTGDKIVAMCHVGISGKGETQSAELALSVSSSHRQRGLGFDMLDRAMLHCKRLGIRRIFMYCLATNTPMQRMARKLGMKVVTEFDESTGLVELSKGSIPTAIAETMAADTMALYDLSCRQAINAVSCLIASMITPHRGTIIPIED